MHCPRCHRLMVVIRLENKNASISFEALSGWHCLLCGEVIDPGIVANRKSHQEPRDSSSVGIIWNHMDGVEAPPW
jgi:hypothetical protein